MRLDVMEGVVEVEVAVHMVVRKGGAVETPRRLASQNPSPILRSLT
jgi:hypothetical protein